MSATPRASGMIDRIADAAPGMTPAGLASPAGIAFTVPELLILTAWAEFHGIKVVVELDYCIDGSEYEEVAALYPKGSLLRQWTLWRSREAVMVVPMSGAPFRADCIAELLPRLLPAV